MKLSNIKVHKKNILFCAIHRKYGIVWTDGRKVCLTPLPPSEEFTSSQSLEEIKIGTSETFLLGEFRKVENVAWSDAAHPRAFLTVIYVQDFPPHLTALQIWQVVQITPKVELSLILNQPLSDQPSLQGCVTWCTNNKKMCLVLKRSMLIYYDVEGIRFRLKGTLTQSAGNAEFRCASWALDSKVLLAATYMTVSLYECDHENINLQPYYTANIPGAIVSLALSGEVFLCACEMLLESFLNHNLNGNSFPTENLLTCQGDGLQCDVNLYSTKCLMSTCPLAESSLLVVISEVGQVVSKISLSGILSPNLLTWLPFHNRVVVGSIYSKSLYVFSVRNGILSKMNEASLPPHLRPKGMTATGENDDSVYLALGSASSQAHLFPSSSEEKNTDIELFVIPLSLLVQKNLLLSGTSDSLSVAEAGPSSKHESKPEFSNEVDSEIIMSTITKNLLQKLENMKVKEPITAGKELKGLYSTGENIKRNATIAQNSNSNSDTVKDQYATLKETETVSVTCHFTNTKSLKLHDTTKQIMLLPGGRLKISTLMETFNIKNVEIFNGSVFSVMTSSEDGCIPVKFRNNEKIYIRGPQRL